MFVSSEYPVVLMMCAKATRAPYVKPRHQSICSAVGVNGSCEKMYPCTNKNQTKAFNDSDYPFLRALSES